jgi:Domain of unknown function (DUF397)
MELAHVRWRKSAHSSGNAARVDVADLPNDDRAVRDSTNPAGAVLTFPAAVWSAFTTGIQLGDID